MQGLADFLVTVLDYSVLLSLSLVFGGVASGLFVLRAGRHSSVDEEKVVARSIALLFAGALGLTVLQPLELAASAWFLRENLGQSPFPAFFHTPQFLAGVLRALIAAGLAAAAASLRRRPDSAPRWASVALLTALLAVSGAWLSHAVDRLDHRAELMTLTVLHQLAGGVWLGGLLQLGAAWRLLRERRDVGDLWPTLLSRFSFVAMASVLLMIATGGALAWSYVGTWQGLFGTGYGFLVTGKVALLAVALGLAALNFRMVRRWRQGGAALELHAQVPYLVEGETILVLAVVLLAATLLSLPPSVDVNAAHQRATWSEVVGVLTPKMPVLVSPSHKAELAAGSPLSPLHEASHDAGNAWSEFNHDVAGLALVAMALFSLAAWTKRLPWTRHWPLGFVALAVFVVVRSDPETWPLGPIPFWQGTFGNAEVLQHRLAALLALAIGFLEWRARSAQNPRSWLPYVFPILCIVGGMVLLTHFHSAFDVKSEFLIQASHTPVGLLAVLMGCGRWLELRMVSSRISRLAGLASVLAMLFLGVILASYREL